jgi:hypothetical protein
MKSKTKTAVKRKRTAKSTKRTALRPRRSETTISILGGHPVGSQTDGELIRNYLAIKDVEQVKLGHKIIQQSVIDAASSTLPDVRLALAIQSSESLLPGYATLDEPHRAEISNLIRDISAYLNDTSRKRPLNCLMLATAGAGKSHFIRQLAGKMRAERVQAVTFNMATMNAPDDIAQPVDELRNLKVNDRFPLLFLDEFDSDPSRYASLLPLLWDGELHVGHRNLKLGKAVIILAGSNPSLPKVMDQSAKMQIENASSGETSRDNSKLIDLLSRINGGIINIPDLDLRSANRDRRVDKVCIGVALIMARFGRNVKYVSRAFLRFIAHTKFRYGVRSIAHLIDLIDSGLLRKKTLTTAALALPLSSENALKESSLKLHLLDKDQAFGIVNRWNEFVKDKALISLADPRFLPFYFDDNGRRLIVTGPM